MDSETEEIAKSQSEVEGRQALPASRWFASSFDSLSPALSKIFERLKSSVVQIRKEGRGAGAGIIWSAGGQILTNRHVAGIEDEPLDVILADGQRLRGVVKATSRRRDLASVQVDARDLPAATAGASSMLRVGELVFAIGHPFGAPYVVTAGIVSAIDPPDPGRPYAGAGRTSFIRTDARLAPGNSGGPLVNAAGQVVGINSMIVGQDLGVAVPVDLAKTFLAQPGIPRVHLGIGLQQAPLRISGRTFHKSRGALLVVWLDESGLGARSGLFVGDLLLAADGNALTDHESFAEALEQLSGPCLELTILRGGIRQTINLKVQDVRPTARAA